MLDGSAGRIWEDRAGWLAYIRGRVGTSGTKARGALRVVDLFSGVGGLTLGVRSCGAALGMDVRIDFAVDTDAGALAVYRRNHEPAMTRSSSVSSLVDYRPGHRADEGFQYPPEILDDDVAEATAGTGLVIAGPPCQGHSNLNNRTRFSDFRNSLFMSAAAFAVAARAEAIVIENVVAVRHDRSGVVQRTRAVLEAEGYRVEHGVLSAADMGWPQNRRRFFLVARRDRTPGPLNQIGKRLAADNRAPVTWALENGSGAADGDVLQQAGALSEENRARIGWLFDNDEYDLPDRHRPVCHQKGTTYRAVYGRMHPDRPAPTITTGFMTPGRGRFIHPTERRTINAREAARLQGFPDTFRFDVNGKPPTRSQLAKWIGDAVPMPLGYAAALAVLGPEATDDRTDLGLVAS